MQCWGVPWLWRLSRRCSPHSWGLAVLMPRTCNTPRVGERMGAAAAAAQAVPSPAPLLPGAWGRPACLVAFPSWFSCAPGTLVGRGAPTHPAVRGSVVITVFPLCGRGGVSPSAAHPMEPVGGVNKVDGKGCSLSLHGLASLLSSVRRLCGQVSEGAPWGGPGTPHLPSAPLPGPDPSRP